MSQQECPLDHTAFTSPPSSLPINFIFIDWLEEEKKKRTNGSGNGEAKPKEEVCHECEIKSATLWCENCSVNLCDACKETTHVSKIFRDHTFISVEEKKKKPTFANCTKHHQDCQLFCTDCTLMVCHKCLMDDHDEHLAMSVYKFAETMKVELKGPLENFDDHLESLVAEERTLTQEKEEQEAALKEAIQKIAELTEAKVKMEEEIALKEKELLTYEQTKGRAKSGLCVLQRMIDDMTIDDCMDEVKTPNIGKKVAAGYKKIFPAKILDPPIHIQFVSLKGGDGVVTTRKQDPSSFDFHFIDTPSVFRSVRPLPKDKSFIVELNVQSAVGCWAWVGFAIKNGDHSETPPEWCSVYYVLLGSESLMAQKGVKYDDNGSFYFYNCPSLYMNYNQVIDCPIGVNGSTYQFHINPTVPSLTCMYDGQCMGETKLSEGRIWMTVGHFCCREYQFTLSFKYA